MRDYQLQGLLILYCPMIMLFKYGINYISVGLNLVMFFVLFIIAENEFIKDCRKGYVTINDSILPKWFYKFIDLGDKNEEEMV